MLNEYLRTERGGKISEYFTNAELDTVRLALEHLAEEHIEAANTIKFVSSGQNFEHEQREREEARRIRLLALDFIA